MQSILKYIISISLVLFATILQAQDTTKIKVKEKIPLINSIGIEADLSPVVTEFVTNSNVYSYEGAVNIELKRKYFPVFEFGFAGADKVSNDNIHFQTNGSFARAGIDLSILKTAKKSSSKFKSYLTGGLRLGFSKNSYQIDNILITDDYWGTSQTISYDRTSTNLWFELVCNLRVEIVKNIYMGWSIRNKNLITNIDNGLPFSWYIPGFGTTASTSNWGFNYYIGYRF